MKKTIDVIGLGSALMDFLVEVDDNSLLEFDLKKGEMHLVDQEKTKSVLKKIKEKELKIEVIPGGSSANTLKGIALLGGHVIFCGTIGKDDHGEIYEQEIENIGVNSKLTKVDQNLTGHAVTFITPDSERTFSTHLGAAIHLRPEHVLEEDIKKSQVLHLEGYQLEGNGKETVMHAAKIAKKYNTLISIDLADPGLIRRNKELLTKFVGEYVDIVFMNEMEAKEFTGKEEKEALSEASKLSQITIVKLGASGSLISHQGEVFNFSAESASPVDTTGAGDSYAAGFLYGLTHNWPINKAGKLGSILAARVIEQKGAGMKDIKAKELIHKTLN
jgi:sugar/nucleoside kinase (ribokinase family)